MLDRLFLYLKELDEGGLAQEGEIDLRYEQYHECHQALEQCSLYEDK